MKKLTIKSRFLALASLLAMTVQVQAEDYSLWVNGTQVTSENQENIIIGENEEPTLSFDPQTCTLTLNNASIDCESGNVIQSGLDSLVIQLIGYSNLVSEGGQTGDNLETPSENFIFYSTNPAANLIFTTSEKNPGQLEMFNYSDPTSLYSGFASVIYRNNLSFYTMESLAGVKSKPDMPTVTPAGGVFADSVEVALSFTNIEGNDDYYYIAYQFSDDEEPTFVEDEEATVIVKRSGTLSVWADNYMSFTSDTVKVEFRIVPSKVIDPIVGPEKGEDNDAPEVYLTFDEKDFTDPDTGENIDLTNIVVDNILYTLPAEDGGFDKGDPGEGVPAGIVLATSLTEAEMADVQDLKPGSNEFAEAFKGMTLLLPAGMGEFYVVASTEGGARLCVKIGDGEPVVITGTTYTDITRIPYACPEDTYVYLYHGGTTDSARSTRGVIREKHETATVRVTGVGTHASSIVTVETENTGAGSSVIKENVKVYEMTDGNFADGGHGIVIADVCGKPVTDISWTVFANVTDKSSIDYIDFSASVITGLGLTSSTSRKTEGALHAPRRASDMPQMETLLEGFPLSTLLLLPAGNGNDGRANVVIDGICAELLLADNASFCTPKDFTAQHLTMQRDFTAGEATTLVLPITLDTGQTSAIGALHTFDRVESDYALFSETISDCLLANTPYLFIPAADALSVEGEMNVKRLDTGMTQPETGSFHGTYRVLNTLPADAYAPVSDASNPSDHIMLFEKAAEETTLPAFSCYLTSADGPQSLKAVIADEVPTGIVSLAHTKVLATGKCHDLQGRTIMGSNVKKGVYLVNGKKIIIN